MPYARGDLKICSACREELPLDAFAANRRQKDGLQNQCRSCKGGSDRKWTDANWDYHAQWHRQKRYGLTKEQYDAMVAACDGRCEVCRQPPHPSIRVLDIDHDHVTGRVRGLLCRSCNNALRCEDPTILRALAAYLESRNGRSSGEPVMTGDARRTVQAGS